MLYALTTTLPTAAAAQQLATILIEQKLVACAHVQPAHTAYYIWEGATCTEQEVSLQCITHAQALTAASTYIQHHHPYNIPCIISWPITSHNDAYTKWVKANTHASGTTP